MTNEKNSVVDANTEEFIPLIDAKIQEFITSKTYPSSYIKEGILYALSTKGKKLRPFILWYLGTKLGINSDTLVHIGAVLEIIHTYTLVHDDLPALDNDDLRRGKPTLHLQFNEATAILVGDAMQTEAFYWLSHSSLNISPEMKIAIINEISTICGADVLISGQDLDLRFSLDNHLVNAVEDILKIAELKTAKMFSLPFIITGILATLDNHTKENLKDFGETLGVLFQILDDMEDYHNKEDSNIVNIIGLEDTKIMIEQQKERLFALIKNNFKLKLELESIYKLVSK